jgi:iron(II)-dependent oxidoreductase
MDPKQRIARDLDQARERTHRLLRPVDDERLGTQHDPLLSPLLWDYGHIGVFEELWLVQEVSHGPAVADELLHTYNAIENPRWTRQKLELMDRPTTLAYLDGVRGRALSLLDEVDLERGEKLTRDGFVYDLVVQHENQHDETVCQTLQLLPGGYLEQLPAAPPGREVARDRVAVPAGEYPVGTDAHEPYDNEHGAHTVTLPAFEIDRFPVTNGDWLRFMADGGYTRQELWSADGWEWILTFGTEAPEYWRRDGDGWVVDTFGVTSPVDAGRPVQHVCWFEADAYARWAGGRLPTEFEWEVAASFDPASGRARRHPWGDRAASPEDANLDQRLFAPAPVGSYPGGASPFGCEQMLGDVWEWTSSDFQPYPGFAAYPYSEYSEPFFGTRFKVLRGGSWATCPGVARATFRNWDSPLKRPIFAGLRCAREVS